MMEFDKSAKRYVSAPFSAIQPTRQGSLMDWQPIAVAGEAMNDWHEVMNVLSLKTSPWSSCETNG